MSSWTVNGDDEEMMWRACFECHVSVEEESVRVALICFHMHVDRLSAQYVAPANVRSGAAIHTFRSRM